MRQGYRTHRPLNPAFAAAYDKGAAAYDEGRPLDACPYRDHRTDRGHITFSRAFRAAWRDGWRDRERVVIPLEADTNEATRQFCGVVMGALDTYLERTGGKPRE